MIISNYTVANPSHTDNIGVFINLSKFDIDNTTIALHGQKGGKNVSCPQARDGDAETALWM